MFDAGFFLGFLGVVPAVEGADEVAGDAAEAFKWDVTFFAAAGGADFAWDDTGEATDGVAIDGVVDGAVADAAVVHLADDSFEGVDVLGRVTVELDVGDVAGVAEFMVGGFDFDFLEGGDWVIDRDVEGVGVVFAVVDVLDFAEFFAVFLREATSEAFGRGGKEGEVQGVLLAVFVAAFAHVGDDVEAEFAGVDIFAVVLAGHSDEGFGEADEADGESAMLNDVAESIVRFEFFRAEPVALTHEEWEVADVLVGLEFETFEKFAGDEVHLFVEFFVEALPVGFLADAGGDAVFDADADEVDSGEAEVATAGYDAVGFRENRGEDAGAAAHGRDFGAIVAWFVVFEVVGGVDEAEVREEALRRDFHGLLEDVVVRVSWVVVDAFFDFQDGDWEDWGFAVAEAVAGGVEEFM